MEFENDKNRAVIPIMRKRRLGHGLTGPVIIEATPTIHHLPADQQLDAMSLPSLPPRSFRQLRISTVPIALCLSLATGMSLLSAQKANAQEDPRQVPLTAPFEQPLSESAQRFLAEHCHRCHDASTAEGELDLTKLTGNVADRGEHAKWVEVVNVLNSHQMPPEDEPQPEAPAVARVVDELTARLTAAEKALAPQSIIMRRMNRSQYARTIRDLLGIDFDVSHFPQDATAGGFDNNGSALSLSPMQIELYLDAASQILDRVLVEGKQPPSIRWRFEPESGDSDSNRVEYDGQRVIVNGGRNSELNGGRLLHHSNWDRGVNARDFRFQHAGEYVLRVRAAGRVPDRDAVVASARKFLEHRLQEQLEKRPEHEEYLRREMEETVQHFQNDSDYNYGPPRVRLIQDWQGQPRIVAEFDIPASMDAPQVYEFRTRFPEGKTGVTIEYAYSIPRELENFWFQSHDDFARPEAWIDWMEIEGPVYETWPTAAYKRLLPESPLRQSDERGYVAKVLQRLMSRAYRRVVQPAELTAKLKLYEQARKVEPNAALEVVVRPALQAILVSPHFLFLAEPRADQIAPELTQYELASRLSYFLWSTMPDNQLLKAATQKQLTTPEQLAAQVDRLLADAKSEALVEDFAGQWLGLRALGTNPPAQDLYPEYDRHLEVSLRGESLAFFREIMQHDLSVLNFVRSDFVTINERLARFYEIDGVRGDHFRRVSVPKDAPRGGLVTQGSILSLTSNGTRTSPVKRGTWILQTLLDDDPGLPVANAGDIAPKVPGIDKATVRQRLEIHRELPQCARCHNKIDPLGFALENFNAAGKWREREGFGYQGRINDNDPLIDARAQLPDGTAIDGVAELQSALLVRQDEFTTALARKLLAYSLGRELGLRDEGTVKMVVTSCQANGYTLRSMLKAITQSNAFRQY